VQAELPLSERERLGAEDQRALRSALVRRHAEVLDQQHAVEAVQMAIDVRSPAWRSLAAGMRN
jgi:ATP-dependent Clp protease ATP-binding subunit ClpA